MSNRFLNLYLILILISTLSCSKNGKTHNYIKEGIGSIYKINYNSFIKADSKNEISIGFDNAGSNFNPYLANLDIEIFIKQALFTSLFYIDSCTNKIENNLVEDYFIDESGKNYFFILKQGVCFSNGKKLQAKDVVASLALIEIFLKDSSLYKNYFLNNKQIKTEVISDLKFSISLENPNANLFYALSECPIISEDIAVKFIDNASDFYEYFNLDNISKIATSGPYVIKSFNDREIFLSKNYYYFKTDEENKKLPYSEKIILKFNKLKNREITEFIENKIDVLKLNDEDFDNIYKFYKGSNEVKFIDTGADLKKTIIVYNCYKDVSKEYLKDVGVRKYLSGIIHDSLIQSKLNNKKSLIKKINYDEKMLKKTGVITNNNEGIIFNKNNIKFKLKILCPEEDILLKEIVRVVGEALSHKGMEVNIDIEPFNLFLEKMFNMQDYDIAFINYKFDRGILSYLNLYGADKFCFYPFLFDNNKTADYTNRMMNEAINSLSFQKADEKIKKLYDYFYNNYQLYPVYETKVFYLIRKNIYNLKVNSSVENGFDLKTIERIIKIND